MKSWMTLLQKELLEYRIVIKLPLFLVVFAVVNFAIVLSGDSQVMFSVKSSGAMIDWGIEADAFAGLIGKLNELLAGIVSLVLFFIYVPKTMRKEKQEGSLMFWRSMPVSDTLAVAAKLCFALVVIPAISSVLLLSADAIVWVLASLFMPQDVIASLGISVTGAAMHWIGYVTRLGLMSLALLPIATLLLAVSQLTRYPLLTVIMAIVIFKVAMIQATGSTELGSRLSDIYWLPVTVLTSSEPLSAYLMLGWLNAILLVASVLMFLASVWLRGRDEMLRM